MDDQVRAFMQAVAARDRRIGVEIVALRIILAQTIARLGAEHAAVIRDACLTNAELGALSMDDGNVDAARTAVAEYLRMFFGEMLDRGPQVETDIE